MSLKIYFSLYNFRLRLFQGAVTADLFQKHGFIGVGL